MEKYIRNTNLPNIFQCIDGIIDVSHIGSHTLPNPPPPPGTSVGDEKWQEYFKDTFGVLTGPWINGNGRPIVVKYILKYDQSDNEYIAICDPAKTTGSYKTARFYSNGNPVPNSGKYFSPDDSLKPIENTSDFLKRFLTAYSTGN